MYTLDKIKKQLAADINKALGKKIVQASDLVYPPDPAHGDLSLPCFAAAKSAGKTPVELAGFLVSRLAAGDTAAGIRAAGPYLNITLPKDKLAAGVLKEIGAKKDEYGRNLSGRGERIVIEYSNANTHKEYHVGHLRNISYGDAVSRILAANGYAVTSVSYINDFGIHTAKTLWAYLEFYKKEKLPENKGYFLGKVYVRAAKELEKNQLARELAGFIMKKIEARSGDEYKLWQETRKWSIEEFDRVYRELGVLFKHIFYESDYIERGKKMTAELYEKRFLKKSEGAIIADLSAYGLGVLVFLRSDGTALYPVADLPLALAKLKKYRPARSLYVVDVRQSLYFKQLFKVLELQGVKGEMAHLGHEFVTLPEGAMSSRSGNVITYRELSDQLLKRARAETTGRHKDWPSEKIESVATTLAVAAMKFEMVKVGALQAITFDIKNALRFDGYTAAYLQYTYARIGSILRKAAGDKKPRKTDYGLLNEAKERILLLGLAKYPETVRAAGDKYDPAEIAKYLKELAAAFNDYYHSVPVLKADDQTRQARLVLIAAVAETLKNGLNLLGIDVIKEM